MDRKASPAALSGALKEIRSRVDLAGAVAAVVAAALKAQNADSDAEAAIALQRCVCDVLADQSDRLAQLSAELSGSAAGAP